MNLIARFPLTLSSSASESLVKTSFESQSPLSANDKIYEGTEKPVVCRDTSHAQGHKHQFGESTDEWRDDRAWSSQECEAHELMDDRTGTPLFCPRARAHEFQSRFSREHKHVILEEEENYDRTGNPLFALNEAQGHSNSSLETTKQNRNCRWGPDHS